MLLLWIGVPSAHGQTVPNGSLDTSGPAPTAVPNDLGPDDWTVIDGADLAAVGVPIDCANLLVSPSSNGGTFVKAAANTLSTQGISTTVSGIVADVPYMVRFEAASVRHFGQSTGQWAVSFSGSVINSATLPLPAANPGQGAWQAMSVGPFEFAGAVGADQPLAFRAATNQDGTTDSPQLPVPACDYPSNRVAADLLIDGIVVVADVDRDGLYTDEELVHGTQPANPDTDGDGLKDGAEIERSTDPLAADTDGDGTSDGAEVANGTNPLDPQDPPPGTEPGTTTPGTTTTPTTDGTPEAPEKDKEAPAFGFSSGCSTATTGGPALWTAVVVALWLGRRPRARRTAMHAR